MKLRKLIKAQLDIFNKLIEMNKDIDSFIKKVKKQNLIETSKDRLSKKFDEYIKILTELHCPEIIINILSSQKDFVIKKTIRLGLQNEGIPFMPVIPSKYLSFYSLVSMAKRLCILLEDSLNFNDIKELNIPKECYFIYGVEEAKSNKLYSHDDIRDNSKVNKFSGLTITEGVMFYILTDKIPNNYIKSKVCYMGSYYSDNKQTYLSMHTYDMNIELEVGISWNFNNDSKCFDYVRCIARDSN